MQEDYLKCYTAVKTKLKKIIGRLSRKALRQVLTLLVMLKSDQVPGWVKASIIATLGYLLLPLDLVPDILPGGLLDDLAAIAVLLAEISVYQTNEIEQDVDKLMSQF
ncbi:MAG: DUF1232 domain-containing protein [Victivallaceae bacterium]|nr:DUF1232 domain-containing protein [Victivallaceae bacterium]